MALRPCPACSHQCSVAAATCPQCGHPLSAAKAAAPPSIFRASSFRGPPYECRECGGKLKKRRESKSQGSGCIIIILGLCLAPVLIGIPIILYGIHVGGKVSYLWQCRKCDATYPRHRRWYELS